MEHYIAIRVNHFICIILNSQLNEKNLCNICSSMLSFVEKIYMHVHMYMHLLQGFVRNKNNCLWGELELKQGHFYLEL